MDDPTPQAAPADLHPVRSVELDLPTLGRLVTAEAKALTEQADHVHDEITALTDDIEADGTIIAPTGAAGVVSTDELVAQLNGIGSTAYRIARHLRTLIDLHQANHHHDDPAAARHRHPSSPSA